MKRTRTRTKNRTQKAHTHKNAHLSYSSECVSAKSASQLGGELAVRAAAQRTTHADSTGPVHGPFLRPNAGVVALVTRAAGAEIRTNAAQSSAHTRCSHVHTGGGRPRENGAPRFCTATCPPLFFPHAPRRSPLCYRHCNRAYTRVPRF